VMSKYFYTVCALLLAGVLVRGAPQAKPDGQTAAKRTLKVTVHYKGTGEVDKKHKIFVVLFDSQDFVRGGAVPIAMEEATSKDGTVTFANFTASPVYVAASYDPNGVYDGQSGPPPSGSSMGMYSKTAGKPDPINVEAGKTVEVEVTFDDSVKMP
jgi:hypothetical protein